MLALAIGLGILAALLAVPVPLLLADARWPSRAPATALLLWQSIALAGGLSMLGALIIGGLAPLGSNPFAAVSSAASYLAGGALPTDIAAGNVILLCTGVVLGAHLLLTLGTTVLATERDRRRHRLLLDVLSTPSTESGTRLIDNDAPMAYCLPAGLHSVTVLSAGLVRALSADELRAVVAHERAHLAQRHHIVLTLFTAWNRALPWFPIASRARLAVGVLVEMLADDHARRSIPAPTLARAIGVVASLSETQPHGVHSAVPSVDSAALPRIRRLTAGHSLPLAASAAIAFAALLLLAVPTAAIIVPW